MNRAVDRCQRWSVPTGYSRTCQRAVGLASLPGRAQREIFGRTRAGGTPLERLVGLSSERRGLLVGGGQQQRELVVDVPPDRF